MNESDDWIESVMKGEATPSRPIQVLRRILISSFLREGSFLGERIRRTVAQDNQEGAQSDVSEKKPPLPARGAGVCEHLGRPSGWSGGTA